MRTLLPLALRSGGCHRRRIFGIIPTGTHTRAALERGAHHVRREEVLAVNWHHHDLHLVQQSLGNNSLDEHRILLQHRCFKFHSLGISRGGDANPVGPGVRQIVLAFKFRLALDDLRLRGGFRILQPGFFARLRLQLGLLGLLLLQRQGMLHRVGFRLGF